MSRQRKSAGGAPVNVVPATEPLPSDVAAVPEPAIAESTPIVPATEPLPSDVAAVIDPAIVDPVAVVPAAAFSPPLPAEPEPAAVASAVEPLVAPVEPLVHVDSTVPLPADQLTPLLHAGVPASGLFRVEIVDGRILDLVPIDDAPAPVAAGTEPLPSGALLDPLPLAPAGLERRDFIAVTEIDHDNRRVLPGEWVSLTRDEHARLFRSQALAESWEDGA